MSVMALAAFLLARAEAGEIRAARKGRSLVTAAVLNPLAAELEGWGLAAEVPTALQTLWQNGLLVEDESGLLRPTPAAFSWLQLPLAISLRLWLQGPLDPELVARLVSYGVVPDESNTTQLRWLALVGLLYREEGRRYRAVAAAKDLLLALSRLDPVDPAGLDAPAQLELAHACQVCFPGNLPGQGWLRWQQADFCFSFARPKVGQPFSFQPWQLFRLLRLCRPTRPEGAKADRFYCLPDRELVGASGLSISQLQTYLAQGLRGEWPDGLARIIREWLADYKQLVVKDLTVLETVSPQLMNELVADRKLRNYLKPLLSARHAVVQRFSLKQLAALLKRRGFYLLIEDPEPGVAPKRAGSRLVMTHAQLQELYTALAFYHWQLTQNDLEAAGASRLLELLQQQLSGSETEEAMQEATRLVNQLAGDGSDYAPPPVDEEALRQHLEAVIAQEGEVWVEYYVPHRPPQKRKLKPHQLYSQNERYYLIAHCYLREGEREFRLDRLRLAVPPNLPQSSENV